MSNTNSFEGLLDTDRPQDEVEDKSGVLQFRCLPKQLEYMSEVDKKVSVAYIGGIGAGKTFVLSLQLLRELAVPNSRLALVAPSYRMLEDVTARTFFELCPKSWIKAYKKSDKIIQLVNGSEALLRSADTPGPLAGLNLDGFAGDEVGLWDEDVWKMLWGRVRRPGGRHKRFVVGNAAGLDHWTATTFLYGPEKYPNLFKLVVASSKENTFLDTAYTAGLGIAYGENTNYYRQYVLGQFVSTEGAYWITFKPYDWKPDGSGGHVIQMADVDRILPPEKGRRFGRVIDFGFEHPFVHLWYVTDGKTIVFYDEHVANRTTIREHVETIRRKSVEHTEKWRFHYTGWAWTDHDAQVRAEIENCKDTSGTDIGFGCSIANKSDVMRGIIFVQSLFDTNRIYITDRCATTIKMIPGYRSKPKGKEAPIKEKDDQCDCIRMACVMEIEGIEDVIRLGKGPEDIFDDLARLVAGAGTNPTAYHKRKLGIS